MSHPPISDTGALFEFTDRFLADAARGRVFGVEHYLALFPGHERALRAEYAELALAHAAPSHATLHVGPYRLVSELGRGGQARVWLAEHTRLGRKVALKVLGGTLVGASHERRERFRREAELVARLEHPGICGVLDADLDAEPPWIAMRHVAGETLAAALERERAEHERAGGDAPCPVRGAHLAERLHFVERVARALHAAHEAGVVHRDVKPGNIMLATDGAPVVLDFGLAFDEDGGSALTRTGDVFGTPAYMAPEQLDGRTADRRTDVYALGVVLYEVVTLCRPFAAASSAALTRAIRTDLPPDARELNPALPRDLTVVLATALEKEPARRYATALELAEELRRVREFEPIVARPVGLAGRLVRWSRRHPAVAAATGGSILVLSLALAAALLFIQELRDQRNAKTRALVEKDAALALYEGAWFRDLAAARAEVSPPEALRLALAAAERDPGLASNRALLTSLADHYELATLSGHTDDITELDVSRANGRVATACADGSVRVWDAERARTLAVLTGHTGRVWCVRFDPSGERVVTAGEDHTARIWRWKEPAAAPLVLAGHDGEVEYAEFGADGEHVVTAARDRTARIWRASDGALEHVLAGHTGNVSLARFCPHGRLVVTASGEPPASAPFAESDHTLRIFDAVSGAALAVCAEHTGPIRALAEAPDGRSFVSVSEDATARLWSLELDASASGVAELHARHVFRFPGYGFAASFSPDGQRLALAYDAGARVVDAASGATLYELPDHAHRAVIDIAFDPRGETLATAAFDNTVRIFDATSPVQLALCRGTPTRPRGVVWGPDGRWLASWHTTRDAKVWFGGTRPFLTVLAPHAGALATARFDPAGRAIVVACADGRAVLFDAANGALVRRLGDGSHAPLVAADFDARGARVVAASADGAVRVFDAVDGACVRSFETAAGAPNGGLLAGDGRWLCVAESGEPALADLATGALLRLRGARGHVVSLACAGSADPRGALVVCGTDERTVHAWRIDGARAQGDLDAAWSFGPYEELNHRLNSVYDVAVSPDRRWVLAATQHLQTYLLDAANGTVAASERTATAGVLGFTSTSRFALTAGKWTGFVLGYRIVDERGAPSFARVELRDVAAWSRSASYRSLAVSPTGDLVVAGSLDRTAKLWDLATGDCLAVYPGHSDSVVDADFAPDGAHFVTCSEDGTARIWPVDVLATARAALPAGGAGSAPLPRPAARAR